VPAAGLRVELGVERDDAPDVAQGDARPAADLPQRGGRQVGVLEGDVASVRQVADDEGGSGVGVAEGLGRQRAEDVGADVAGPALGLGLAASAGCCAGGEDGGGESQRGGNTISSDGHDAPFRVDRLGKDGEVSPNFAAQQADPSKILKEFLARSRQILLRSRRTPQKF